MTSQPAPSEPVVWRYCTFGGCGYIAEVIEPDPNIPGREIIVCARGHRYSTPTTEEERP